MSPQPNNENEQSLLDALSSSDTWAAIAATKTLGQLHACNAIPHLLRKFEETDDILLKLDNRAHDAYSEGDAHGAIAIAEHLIGDLMSLRLEIVRALGLIGDKSAAAYLVSLLEKERDLATQAMLAWSLGELGATNAIPLLASLLSTYQSGDFTELQYQRVKQSLQASLQKLTHLHD